MGKILLVVLLIIFSSVFFSPACLFLLSKRRRKETTADVIIVLGAKILPDGTPSNTLKYRLDAAKKAFDRKRAPAIIVTGGQGKDENEPEAKAMKRYLVNSGIDQNVIFEENTSQNTIENLQNARAFMEEKGYRTAVIATTDYHMDRARLIAKRLSIKAGAACAEPGRKLSNRILAYMREAASWCLLIVKIAAGKI